MTVVLLLALQQSTNFDGGNPVELVEHLHRQFGVKVAATGFSEVPPIRIRRPTERDLEEQTLECYLEKEIRSAGAVVEPNEDDKIVAFRWGNPWQSYPVVERSYANVRVSMDLVYRPELRTTLQSSTNAFAIADSSSGFIELDKLIGAGRAFRGTPFESKFHLILSPGEWSKSEMKVALSDALPLRVQEDEVQLDGAKYKIWLADACRTYFGDRPEFQQAFRQAALEFLKDIEDETLEDFAHHAKTGEYIRKEYRANTPVANAVHKMMKVDETHGTYLYHTRQRVLSSNETFRQHYGARDYTRGPRMYLLSRMMISLDFPVVKPDGTVGYTQGSATDALTEFVWPREDE